MTFKIFSQFPITVMRLKLFYRGMNLVTNKKFSRPFVAAVRNYCIIASRLILNSKHASFQKSACPLLYQLKCSSLSSFCKQWFNIYNFWLGMLLPNRPNKFESPHWCLHFLYRLFRNGYVSDKRFSIN